MNKPNGPDQRYRRMLSLETLTEQLIQQNQHPELVNALLQDLIKKLFGETIAQKVVRITLDDHQLHLRIPDEAWRKEMLRRKEFILKKAKEIHSPIQNVEVTA